MKKAAVFTSTFISVVLLSLSVVAKPVVMSVSGKVQADSITANNDGSLTVVNPHVLFFGEYLALVSNENTADGVCSLLSKSTGTLAGSSALSSYDKGVLALDKQGNVSQEMDYNESPEAVELIKTVVCR
jgi:hypothetical protein